MESLEESIGRSIRLYKESKLASINLFKYLLAVRKKNTLQANVMTYYNVVIGCSSSDVTSGAL